MAVSTQAYCVKCREKREMVNPVAIFLANGKPATQGTCPVCGGKLTRLGATEAHEGLPRPEVVASSARPAKKGSAGKAKAKKKTASPSRSSAASANGTAKSAANGRASAKTSAKPKAKTSAKSGGKAASNGDAVRKSRSARRNSPLVIVESPAKARTVGRFLGGRYVVKASKGHVRDLLVTQLSVDVENGFEPKYRVPNEKRDTIKDLKRAVEDASEIYLATDPDREGEAIAWHLIAATDMDEKRVKRVVFHEITDAAVQHAFEQPRAVDMNLVNAQQARRILDRIVGYTITELLWDRVRNRLSAGRVQSVALRLIVDRERQVEAFVPEEYWTLDAELYKGARAGKSFIARLVKISGKDASFGSQGAVAPHLDILERSQYAVSDVKEGTKQRKPSAPFTTSTLQQEASRRLGFNAQRTMQFAQQLYEGVDLGKDGVVGLISYMRTDSTTVSAEAQKEARAYIKGRFGGNYIPDKAPIYKTKAKGAQEAHEAIRPTSVLREPNSLTQWLTRDQLKLYRLIWERFVASQMTNAVYNTLRVEISAGPSAKERPYLFRVSSSTIKFPGFLALYEDAHDEDVAEDMDMGRVLPDLKVGDALNLARLLPEQHFTQPPPRFTEASLVRTLEEFGIGRPSTYAPTVKVIQDREYVEKKDKRLVPTETGRLVNDLLVQYFPDILDYQFTARMEDQLDTIAEGDAEWRPVLQDFYTPFEQQLVNARAHMPSHQKEEHVGRPCPVSGHALVVRYGRWGKFIGCSDYPNCTYTEPYLELTGVVCPKCGVEHGGQLVARRTRRGRTFFGCSRYPDCDYSTWKLPGKPGGRDDGDGAGEAEGQERYDPVREDLVG
jgi:DNA topoisomerase-1